MIKDIKNYAVVGVLQEKITRLLEIYLPNDNIYMAPGVRKHVKKRHEHCLKYLEFISDIVDHPDYVGINPSQPYSIELVKIFDNNILVSINLSTHTEMNYLYVSSLYDISNGKLHNRINSGRLRKILN